MEKNTVWAISLSTVVLVGFFAAQTFLFPPQVQEQNQTENQTEQNSAVVENNAGSEESSVSENHYKQGSGHFYKPWW